ncbi:MAG TPA: MliC family protein [Geopsychrobacteraceae bacterium]|nr:MliC family protein [Geopsychrobacteraceae bacterium]
MNDGMMILTVSLRVFLLVISSFWLFVGVVVASSPSFDCNNVNAGSIEDLVCKDDRLAFLDRKLAEVYASATRKAINEHPPKLKAEQRGWLKGRNECWKNTDRRKCVGESYRLRIAELQALYRLIPATSTVRYMCDGDPRNEVIATFFATVPATLIAERGDSVSLMFHQPNSSGTMYRGRNESLLTLHDETVIVWGHGALELRCQGAPMKPFPPLPGSERWIQEVERVIGTGDNAGHGPDIGSDEWMYTVGRKLGIYDSQGLASDIGSDEWHELIHRLVFHTEAVP